MAPAKSRFGLDLSRLPYQKAAAISKTLNRIAVCSGLIGSLLILAHRDAGAQSDIFELPRLNGPIELDGMPSEKAWSDVDPLPLSVHQPVFGREPSEPTVLKIAYDENFLYVAGLMYDQQPEGIRANSLYRDRYSGDDTIGLIVDTFNDNENALWFFTTPTGVRFDMSVSNDANFGGGGAFGSVINDSWNTFWDVATQQNDQGWFAEMRIPYSSLGFQSVDGRVHMGLIVYRFIARKNERQMFPNIPPNWNMAFAKPSQAQDVVLRDVSSQKPVYLTPYALTGPSKVSELNDAETAFRQDDDFRREVGLDLKYNLTSNLTVDLTLNTDFAQVEADQQQVNLSRFSLFFPEKRQFFQERAGVFEFDMSFQDRLFHSRQIGVYEGELIRILGGTRLVGRVGKWDIGILNMQTDESTELPAENFGVARLRRRILNDYSTAGVITTTRIGLEGGYNVAYGADGIIRVLGDEYLTLKWSQTFDSEIQDEKSVDFIESAQFLTQWERRVQQGLSYRLQVKRTGTDFDPGLGFLRREDVLHVFTRAAYGWFATERSAIRRHTPILFTSVYFRNEDNSVESAFLGGDWGIQFKSSAELAAGFEWSYEDFRSDTLSLPNDIEITDGTYRFTTFNAQFRSADGDLLRIHAFGSIGGFFDGTSLRLNFGPTWNLSRHLELSAEYGLQRGYGLAGDKDFTVHLTGIRTQIGFNTRASIDGFVQYNSADDLLGANIRFRYNFSEGNDLWLVFNEGLITDREAHDPRPPRIDNRALILKYTHTLGL